MIDEEDILARLRGGDARGGFELLVERLQTKVFHLAISLLRDEAWARDATQEAFLRVWRGLGRYSAGSSLSTWVYAIARNTCYTELRKRASRPTVSLEDQAVAESVACLPDPAGEGGWTDRPEILECLIGRLPPAQQAVLRLFYFEGRSYEEAAALLGIPMGTVKTHLHRAKQELLRALRKEKHDDLRTV